MIGYRELYLKEKISNVKKEDKDVKKEENEWTYNKPNDEYWCQGVFDTKEEVEKEAIEYGKEHGYSEMSIGRCIPLPLPDYIDAENILQKLQEWHDEDTCGDYDEDLFEEIKNEDFEWLEKELSKVIKMFYKRAGVKTAGYSVSDVYNVKI